jgi:(1->4)-alpha-D-glucan 1-alpha-D-glucosylmutase
VFERGAYEPLPVTGERAEHVIAFARGGDVVTVVPRFVLRLDGDWRDTAVRLPDARWCDVLTGRSRAGGAQRMADVLAEFPVALLARE